MNRIENKATYCVYKVEKVINGKCDYFISNRQVAFMIVLNTFQYRIKTYIPIDVFEKLPVEKLIEIIIEQSRTNFLMNFYKKGDNTNE